MATQAISLTADNDPIWQAIRSETEQAIAQEPVLASFLHATILNHQSLECALSFHLAPPIFSRGKDARGRPLKTTFGPWMLAAFRLLAGGKFLRGTAFDPFGRLAERREERELIEDYRTMVEELLGALSAENLSIAIECANLPDQVRGYGPVKTESIADYYQQRVGLLHRFHNPASAVQIQDVA